MLSSPEKDAIRKWFEKAAIAGVHGYEMLAVRVILQGFVYPVNKGHLFFLCKQKILVANPISQNSLHYKNIILISVQRLQMPIIKTLLKH